jgi:hypothetical protein
MLCLACTLVLRAVRLSTGDVILVASVYKLVSESCCCFHIWLLLCVLQVCDAVMQLRAHKSRLVRVTVTSLLPQLVSLNIAVRSESIVTVPSYVSLVRLSQHCTATLQCQLLCIAAHISSIHIAITYYIYIYMCVYCVVL